MQNFFTQNNRLTLFIVNFYNNNNSGVNFFSPPLTLETTSQVQFFSKKPFSKVLLMANHS